MKFNEKYEEYIVEVGKIPMKLYHVTPTADKIIKDGFKIGVTQTFGDAGAKSGISFFDNKSIAEYYKLGLQYYIAWANSDVGVDDLFILGEEFNVNNKEISNLVDSVKTDIKNNSKKPEKDIVRDAMVTLVILSKGKFPWILSSEKRLKSLDIEGIDILEITLKDYPTKYEYKRSETEWRVYDIDALNTTKRRIL